MKTCFKCSRTLLLSEFYRHPKMGDGHLGKCKDCTKADVCEHRLANLDRVRAYDHGRAQLQHRVTRAIAYTRTWRQEHPERQAAHIEVQRAVRSGELSRPGVCERCGEPKRLEAHHRDYNKPLDVQWLCKPCHFIADCERRAAA